MNSFFPTGTESTETVSFFPTFQEDTAEELTDATTTHSPSFPMPIETHQISHNMPTSPLENMRILLDAYKPSIERYRTQLPPEVKTQDEANITTRIAGAAKSEIKLIETKRKDITAPINDVVKKINGLCKEVTDPLTEIENLAKKRLNSFHAFQEMERQKIAEAERQRAVEEQKRLDAKAKELGVEAPIVPEILAPEKTNSTCTRTEHGTSYTKKIWSFTIQNASEIPLEYLIIDERKIKEAVKAGIRNIPGVNIYEQSSVAIRS